MSMNMKVVYFFILKILFCWKDEKKSPLRLIQKQSLGISHLFMVFSNLVHIAIVTFLFGKIL